jgi:hypothetical protein
MAKDDEPLSEDGAVGEDEPHPSSSRVLRFARRLMDRREIAEDTKELLSALLSSSDKVKSEAVRLMARELRMYLRELRLKEDLIDLVRSHSLEISIHLKPLTKREDGAADAPVAGADPGKRGS